MRLKGNKLKYKDAFIFILLGSAVILVSLVSEGQFEIGHIVISFLSHVGIGLLVIGILGILIDFSHWTEYFEKRLSNIVIEKKYLEKLDQDSLIKLQTEVLKAYYKNDNIGGADGFLDFYHRNIQSLVSIPFRNNANLSLRIDYWDQDPDKFMVYETMSWVCKSNGGKIQDTISWVPGENEFEQVLSFQVSLQHKALMTRDNPGGLILFDYSTLKKKFPIGKLGFCVPIEKYKELDELYVVVKNNYVIPKERFMGWRMSFPTRRMSLVVQFPKELEIITELFFCDKNVMHDERGPGQYYLTIEDWIMTDEGITIQLIQPASRKGSPAHKVSQAAAENHGSNGSIEASANGSPEIKKHVV
jgi:hypothetical protein